MQIKAIVQYYAVLVLELLFT